MIPFPLAFLTRLFIASKYRFRTEPVIDDFIKSFFVSVKYLRNWYHSTPLFFHFSSKFFRSVKNLFSSKQSSRILILMFPDVVPKTSSKYIFLSLTCNLESFFQCFPSRGLSTASVEPY